MSHKRNYREKEQKENVQEEIIEDIGSHLKNR